MLSKFTLDVFNQTTAQSLEDNVHIRVNSGGDLYIGCVEFVGKGFCLFIGYLSIIGKVGLGPHNHCDGGLVRSSAS